MAKGMLVDLTKCMGCRGCQVACKQWNQLPAEKTTWQGTYENPPDISPNTYTQVRFVEGNHKEQFFWRFYKTQCKHCLEPACVSACLVKAMEKKPGGPVTYNEHRCMGCRYCMIACPFNTPKFEYDKAIPRIRKCQFCFDRQEMGRLPACAQTCPAGTLKFGERDELLDIAKGRIYKEPNKYVHHIYGEHEAGGTSWLYISDIPFEKLGFPTNIGTAPYPGLTKDFLYAVPIIFIAVPSLLLAISYIKNRRNEDKVESKEGK